jgi:hypothetical protein
MEMRSSNPVLNNNFWSNLNGTERMTIEGSMQKTGFLLGVTVLSALVSAVLCLNALNSGDGGALIFGHGHRADLDVRPPQQPSDADDHVCAVRRCLYRRLFRLF